MPRSVSQDRRRQDVSDSAAIPGHAYTDNALLEAVMESTGEMLYQVIRSLEEGVMLLDHMGRHLEHAGDQKAGAEIFPRRFLGVARAFWVSGAAYPCALRLQLFDHCFDGWSILQTHGLS